MAILNHTSTPVETEPQKPREQPAMPPMETGRQRSRFRWSKRDTLLIVLVLLVAGGLRILRLAEPNAVVFDETYYAKDACLYLGNTQTFCNVDQPTEQSYVHPPLGKWLISLGISAFGYNSFGWRFSASIFGTALAGLVYLATRKLFRSRWAATVAGLLVAGDLLLIAQSRIAMLDIFLAFFVLLGFWFLVLDRERVLSVRDWLASLPPGPGAVQADDVGKRAVAEGDAPRRHRRYRLAAGLALGLALSVKWSALLALAAVAATAFFWSLELLIEARKHRSSSRRRLRKLTLRRELAATVTAFVLVPALVYVLAYAAYFVDRYGEDCPYTVPGDEDRLFDSGLLNQPEGKCVTGFGGTLLSFADLQERMLDYHANLDAKHSYQSRAWTWPLVLRPVAYHYESGEGKSTEVMGTGNVATWYGALVALLWLIPRSLRRWQPERMVVVAWATQYLPWLLVPRPLFLFYMTPIVPFMMIGLASALDALRRHGKGWRYLVAIYLALAAALVVLFYPVVAAVPLPQEWWRRLMWIPQFDCGGFMCGWI